MDKEKCKEWDITRRSPSPINPLTNRKIKKNGPKYKQLDNDCKDLIVDMNSVCMKWLKDNHSNLYMQLAKQRSEVKQRSTVIITDDEDEPIQPPYYTIEERKGLGQTIKSYFQKVVIEDGKACMTQNKTLLKYVDKPKLLGYGSFGNVYAVSVPTTNFNVAIKEGRVTKTEFNKAMDKRYPIEYLFNKLINDLINDKICPNFTYTFAIFFCDKCTLNEFDKKPIKTQCSETVVELFNFTLDKLKDLRDEVVLSILFQVLFSVASIQLKYGMFHNDIKKENILIKVIPAGGFWEYNLDGIKYRVPNYGYIAALNDFGVSIVFHPGITIEEDYGRRQAEVVLDSRTKEYYFRPFTTKFYPSIQKNGRVDRVPSYKFPGSNLTWNRFYKNFDSQPSIKVDLENMRKFPPYNFHNDILDTIYMFIGGKRTSQPDNHYPMKISKNLKSFLEEDFYMVKTNKEWPVNRVDLFLANHTIKNMFPFYTDTSLSGPLIEKYYL